MKRRRRSPEGKLINLKRSHTHLRSWISQLCLPLHHRRKRDSEAPTQERKTREDEREWKETEECLRKNKDTEGVRRGGAWRLFIYTAGFMASCVCCVAWEPSPPGQRKQHHFKLECPLRRQVSCQNVHGCRIPRKSPDLFPNNRCVHLSHSTQKGLSLVTVVPLCAAGSKRSQPTWLSHHIRMLRHWSLRRKFMFLRNFL